MNRRIEGQQASRRWRPDRRLGIVLATLIGLLVLGRVLAGRLLDEGRIEAKVAEALFEATDSLYRLQLDDLRFRVLRGQVIATGVRIAPDGAVLERRRNERRLPATLISIETKNLELGGVNLWSILTSRSLSARGLRVTDPRLTITKHETPSDEKPRPVTDRIADIAKRDPSVRIGRVRVQNGYLTLRDVGAKPGREAVLSGVELELEDLVLDSTAVADSTRVLFTREFTLGIAGFRRVADDSLHVLEAGPMHLSSDDSTLTLDTLRYSATLAEAHFRQLAHRSTRYDIEVTGVRTGSLDVQRLLHGEAVHAQAIDIGRLDVDLLLDKTPPQAPGGSAALLHEAFQRIDRDVVIDTIRLDEGTIRYSERAEDGIEDGIITFGGVTGLLTNVTNDSARMTEENPAVLNARARIENQGPLHAVVRVPLLAETFDMDFEGTLGSMHAPAMNSMLENLDGISIESGNVARLTFDGCTTNGVSGGTLTAVYDDLSIRMFEKREGDQPVGKWLETFISNTFVVRGSNLPEDGELPHRGTIDHTREPGQPFFAFLWASLRSGILSQIGM